MSLSEADARYTNEVHPFWCLQKRVIFPWFSGETWLWYVFFFFYCNTRLSSIWIKDNVWHLSSKIHFLQLWRSAPNRTVWWGPTSIQQWNLVCNTCSTGSVSSTQVQLSTGYQLNILVLLHDSKTSQLLQSLCIFLTIFCLVFSPSFACSAFVFRYYFWRRICGCVHHGQTHRLPKRQRDSQHHSSHSSSTPGTVWDVFAFVWFKQRLKKHSDLLIK